MDKQPDQVAANADDQFEREKWLKECEFREREFVLRAREVLVQEGELEVKRTEQRRWVVANPFVIALIAATTAAFANVFVAMHNGSEQRVIEQSQAEHARIVTAITGDAVTASDKLRFLLDTHLITDEATRKSVTEYIDSKQVTPPAKPPTPPPENSTAKRVEVQSGWLGGGHNQSEVCAGLMNAAKA
jgi:hypothetical protein